MAFATSDERVSSVILRGSRTNPNALVDEDSDYDVLLGVSDLSSFQNNDEWLNIFGDIFILQKPESMIKGNPHRNPYKETYLMQFKDDYRLDMVLLVDSEVQNEINQDSLSVILLDKIGLLVAPEPDDSSYIRFDLVLEEIVNEFLWLSFYVLKGYKRKQIMYTQNHLNMMREEFLNLVTLQFNDNPGAHYKYAEKHLNAYELNVLKETFNLDVANGVKSLFELFSSYLSKTDFDQTQFEEVRYYIENKIQLHTM